MKKIIALVLIYGLTLNMGAQKINPTGFNKSTPPDQDFYDFVNAAWEQQTAIPDDQFYWSSFHEVLKNNQEILKTILEEASTSKSTMGSTSQIIGDFYGSGMDQSLIDQLGMKPIESLWRDIDGIDDYQSLAKVLAKVQNVGVGTPFNFTSLADAKNSSVYAGHFYQGGLHLPARDYYLGTDDRSVGIRNNYVEHITRMLELAQVQEDPSLIARQILELEKRLAYAHRAPVQNRDPERLYNKLDLAQLKKTTYYFDWETYFEAKGIDIPDYLVIMQPEVIIQFDRLLGDLPLDQIRWYLKWSVLTNYANYLSSEFKEEDFAFYGKELKGTKEPQPRWKFVQSTINALVGEPLGQEYVKRAFPPEAKTRMLYMIDNLKQAFAQRIDRIAWMSDQTKREALKKLSTIKPKIGYPDEWRNFSSLIVKSDDFVGNVMRAEEFNTAYVLKRIGKPLNPNDWGLSPPTVNAYYSPTRNEIVFPAGILQPPFFDLEMEDAVNYGAIGAVIGHEIIHGFDDQGSQFDSDGNLRMWWTAEDRSRFESLAQKIVQQYDGYKVLDTVSVNGQLTLGENIADLAGLTLAYDAFKSLRTSNKKRDGFTPDQRFFIGFARIWRTKFRDQFLLELVKSDPHAPGRFRANGTLSNFPAFHKAFKVPLNSRMRNQEIVEIW